MKVHIVTMSNDIHPKAFSSWAKANAFVMSKKSELKYIAWKTHNEDSREVYRDYLNKDGSIVARLHSAVEAK